MRAIFFRLPIAAILIAIPAAAQENGGARTATPPTPANDHSAPAEAYPPMARLLGEHGQTLLVFTVKEDGTVAGISVAKSSGHARLDAASVSLARHWLYHPAMENGKAIAETNMARVHWQLPAQSDTLGKSRIFMQQDDFPPGAWSRHEEGVDSMVLSVDAKGNVLNCQFTRQSGFDDLDKAAEEYLTKGWPVTPLAVAGQDVGSDLFVNIVWTTLPDEIEQ